MVSEYFSPDVHQDMDSQKFECCCFQIQCLRTVFENSVSEQCFRTVFEDSV